MESPWAPPRRRSWSIAIADLTGMRRTDVRDIVQLFLDGMVEELADGNRWNSDDFGVFEVKHRAARIATPRLLSPFPFLNECHSFQSGPADEDGHGRPTVRSELRRPASVPGGPATAEVEVLGAAGRQAEVKPLAPSKKTQVQPKATAERPDHHAG